MEGRYSKESVINTKKKQYRLSNERLEWTTNEKIKLLELYFSGKSYDYLANHFKRSLSSIYTILQKIKTRYKHKKIGTSGRGSCGHGAYLKPDCREGLHYTERENEWIKTSIKWGKAYGTIAMEMGRSVESVNAHIKTMLKKRKPTLFE